MHNNGKRSLAIIPCYNEETTIKTVIKKTKKHVDEVLVIDDGSKDNTSKFAKAAGAKVIACRVNRGKSAGIRMGFKYALKRNYDYVVTLDGDGQHNPNEIPELLNDVKNNGHDITLGTRWGDTTEMPSWRKLGKRILDYVTGLGNGGHITDSQCGFRAFNRKAIEKLANKLQGYGFTIESEQLIRAHEVGLKLRNKRISCYYEGLDTSTKTPTSHALSVLRYVIVNIAKTDSFRKISLPGFIFILTGLLIGIHALILLTQTNLIDIGYAILVTSLLAVGSIAVFFGMLHDIVPALFKNGR
jgi:glycosyltransferase involved in cell wall biosynthesis